MAQSTIFFLLLPIPIAHRVFEHLHAKDLPEISDVNCYFSNKNTNTTGGQFKIHDSWQRNWTLHNYVFKFRQIGTSSILCYKSQFFINNCLLFVYYYDSKCGLNLITYENTRHHHWSTLHYRQFRIYIYCHLISSPSSSQVIHFLLHTLIPHINNSLKGQ